MSDPDSTYDYGYDTSGRLETINNSGTPGVPQVTERSSIGGPSNQWNRYYFSSTGVWASEDPIGFGAGDANLRRYVGNEPGTLLIPRDCNRRREKQNRGHKKL